MKSRVPEFVEPKQLKQTRVLVKRARNRPFQRCCRMWSFQDVAQSSHHAATKCHHGSQKGNTVLIHFQYQGILYHAILMMSGSVPGGKGGVDTHKLWKHVIPRSTEFAWLPRELAEAFCLPALQLDANRQYGTLAQCVPPRHQGRPSWWIKSILLVTVAVLVSWKSSSICQLVESWLWSSVHEDPCSIGTQQ